MLVLVLYKFEEDKGLCLVNDDEIDKTDEISYKKQNRRMKVQLMNCFSLHHKNLKKTKDGRYLKNDDENNESRKVCKKHGKVSVVAIVM